MVDREDKDMGASVTPTGPAPSGSQGIRPLVPSADMVTMTRAQIAVLLRMDDDLGYPFRDIAQDCGLPEKETREIVHQFHSQGLTGFGPLYSDDGPGICGSGYWLRKSGWELQAAVSRFLTREEREDLTDPEWAAIRAAAQTPDQSEAGQ